MIALIPARGGSKRIPKKNILPFFGHPMLVYTIAAAKNSQLFSRIIVSTEDEEIAKVALLHGAEVFERPLELAGDHVMVGEVAEHILSQLMGVSGEPEAFCQLMPNCPLRRSFDIQRHWEVFHNEERTFQISVIPFRGAYPQWSLLPEENGRAQWFFKETLIRSQDIQWLVCPTGAIWWARTGEFLKQRSFYGDPFHVELIDANRGLDIDTEEDLELAELIVRGLSSRDEFNPLEPIPELNGDFE